MSVAPILDVRRLVKSFGGAPILNTIDLAVQPSEMVFVIGPSGSGKSTLLRCCNRLEEPDSGSIIVDGVDMMARSTDLVKMRQKIGMVFQSFNLYPHMTALQNVTLALRKALRQSRSAAEAAGQAALERVGLADRAVTTPRNCPAGSNSVLPLRGVSRWDRASCCLMNQPRRSILNWSALCSASCAT